MITKTNALMPTHCEACAVIASTRDKDIEQAMFTLIHDLYNAGARGGLLRAVRREVSAKVAAQRELARLRGFLEEIEGAVIAGGDVGEILERMGMR